MLTGDYWFIYSLPAVTLSVLCVRDDRREQVWAAIEKGTMPEKTKSWLEAQMDAGKQITVTQAGAIIDRLVLQAKEQAKEEKS